MRFTPGELKVMRLLWEHGELKPNELQARFPEPIKNPALRSYLSILVDKGHVTRRKVGKAFYYKAKTGQQRAFSRMLAQLVDTFCQGSPRELMLTLVRDEQLSTADLEQLRQVAGESQKFRKTLGAHKTSDTQPKHRTQPKTRGRKP